MKKIILFLFIGISIFADSKIHIVPYTATGSYNSNISASDSIVGLYTMIQKETYSIELSVESKKQKYNDGSNLNQINSVFSYKTKNSNNLKYNTLVHYIANNADSDEAIITLVGMDKTYNKNLILGLDVAYSFYNTNTLTKNVLQLRPSLKFKYGRSDSKWGILYPRISFYYIKPINPNANLKNSYFSTEIGITHAKNSYITSASMWFGEQLYALRDNGFTIYNLNELHTKGFLVSTSYKIYKYVNLKISYSNEEYTTYVGDVLGTEEESINRVLLIADYTF